MSLSLSVVITRYGDAEKLRNLLSELQLLLRPPAVDKVEYIVADSETAVGAAGIDYQGETRDVRLVHHIQTGAGAFLRGAVRRAENDLCLLLDAGTARSLTIIPVMIDEMNKGADVALVSHRVSDATSPGLTRGIFNLAFRAASGVPAYDAAGGIQLYRTADLKQLRLIFEDRILSSEILLKLRLLKKNCPLVKEVPLPFSKREIRCSAASVLKSCISSARLLIYSVLLRFLTRKAYRPEIHDAYAREMMNVLLYGGIGVFVLILNVAVFLLLSKRIGYLPANFLAWLTSTTVAFVADKTVVFDDWDWNFPHLKREVLSYYCLRVFSGILDILLLWGFVEIVSLTYNTAKAIDAVIVITLNYFFSKCVVFSK